jgi:hypothetical protein
MKSGLATTIRTIAKDLYMRSDNPYRQALDELFKRPRSEVREMIIHHLIASKNGQRHDIH